MSEKQAPEPATAPVTAAVALREPRAGGCSGEGVHSEAWHSGAAALLRKNKRSNVKKEKTLPPIPKSKRLR